MLIGIEAAHANKPKRTGVENVCWHTISELKKIIPLSERVILYTNTPLGGGLEIMPENWQERVLPWPLKKMWSQFCLAREMIFHPPDVFFVPGQLVPWFCPKKTVVIVHDSAFVAYPDAYNFWGRQYLKVMNRLLIKKAAVIITPSEFSKSELIKYYRADPEKIRVASLGYDRETYKKIDDHEKINKVLEKFKINGPYIMSLGRMEEKKNTAAIVGAFDILKGTGNNPDLKLVLAGTPGVGYEKISLAINSSPYKSDIILAGWLSAEEAACLLNRAQVFVFPSLYEGFGIPVLEAMACGCPCVLANAGSLPEAGGMAALYANPENVEEIAGKTGQILQEAALSSRLKNDGYEHVKLFDWSRIAGTVWQAVRDLSENK